MEFDEEWRAYSEIVTSWNSSGPITSGSIYYRNTDVSDYTVSYDAFRRTFGWGWDLYPTVIGSNQWDAAAEGPVFDEFSRVISHLNAHTVEISCVSSGNEVDSTIVGDNFRESGVTILVPYWSKLINTFMMLLSLSLAVLVSSSNRLVKLFARDFFAGSDGIKERRTLSETYFLIGVVSVIVEGGTYLFESAIPNNLSTSCNMKVNAVLDNYVSVIIDSFCKSLDSGGTVCCAYPNVMLAAEPSGHPRHGDYASSYCQLAHVYRVFLRCCSVYYLYRLE